MAIYNYEKDPATVREDLLLSECVAAGLPVVDVQGVGDGTYNVVTDRDLTPTEKLALDNLVEIHDGRPRRERPMLDVYNNLNALNAATKTTIWNQLNAGTPPLWVTDAGPHRGEVALAQLMGQHAAGGSALQTEARLRMATLYVLDNPKWLVNPSFAPAVNIPGDEVIV